MHTQPTSTLIIHPSLAAVPMPPESDPAFQAIVASVCEIGILEPLKVCKGRVVDGRLRLQGAKAAGMDTVPSIEVAEEDVASIILHTLLARNHFTQSALAYLGVPLLSASLAEWNRRKTNSLRIGASGLKSAAQNAGSPKIPGSEVAVRLGVCLRHVEQAVSIHKKFAEYPKLRETWEPKILSGEMCLAQVEQGLSGKITALNGGAVPKNDAGQLLLGLFDIGPVRMARWDSVAPAKKEEALAAFRDKFIPSLPEEFHREYQAFLRTRRVAA